MSRADYETLVLTGTLSATRETFISSSRAYATQYRGVLVEFTVKGGTTKELRGIGVRDMSSSAAELFGELPLVSSGWTSTNAFFKVERMNLNIGLGEGAALNIFNRNIRDFREVIK